MYISKLHINGFKSFLNKTDLTFGEGITTVIGPNGCGKTNIVDAIRWILGEQKHSVLRSSRMEDVIFNGTKTRKPLGFCEVSLTIHNNKGVLPVEYTDVEITRRLYRSGESEYLLNKVPCRLKDINGLFMDTGMGAHAYSVIELKMIDSILSHNPDERRRMFEEAAGINQYKLQRKSTFRKLESTMNDLDRVKDILSEVEDKVHHLKLQLKRFERHKKLSEKLKSSEILLAQVQIQLIGEKIQPLSERLQEKKNQHSRLSGQLSLDESLINETKKRFDAEKEKLNGINGEIAETERRLRRTNDNILIWTEQKKSHESRVSQFTDDLKIAEDRVKTLKDQIEQIQKSIEEKQPHIEKYSAGYEDKSRAFEAVNLKFEETNNQMVKVRKFLENLTREVFNQEAEFQQIIATIEEKDRLASELEQQKSQTIDQVGSLQFDLKEISGRIIKQESVNSRLVVETEIMQKKRAEAEERLMTAKESLMTIKSNIMSETSRQQFYSEIIKKHEGKIDGVRYILSNTDEFKGVLGGVSDLVDVDEKYQSAIESALGETANYLVTDTYENALNVIRKIRKKDNLTVYVIPLDKVPATDIVQPDNAPGIPAARLVRCGKHIRNLVNMLLYEMLVIGDESDYSKAAERIRSSYHFITEDGEVFRKDHVMKVTPKSRIPALGRLKQIERIKASILKLKKQEKDTEKEIVSLEEEANSIRKEVLNQSAKLDAGVTALNKLSSEKSNTEFKLKYSDEHLRSLDEKLKKVRIEKETLIHREKELAVRIRKKKDEISRYQEKQKDDEEKLNRLRHERNKSQQEVQDARVKLIEVEKEIEGYQFRLNSSKEQLRDIERRIDVLLKEKENSKATASRLAEDLVRANDEKEKLNQLLKEQLTEKNIIEGRYNLYFEELQGLQQGIRDQQKIKEENILEIRDYEVKIAELEKEKEFIIHRIQDKYQADIPREILNLNEINAEELKNSIEAIDRSISKIGPINMAVSDEYEQESQRLNFLTEQHDDLIEAEKSLKDTIRKIDEEARSRFLKVFEDVRINFKKTYTMFFDGGEADIRLIGDTDPLESDISIIARPPGKKTQTLRMLSAGEKSLTAIALLFAIYLVKPSPFCILDEVDAPLDDTNISKFTRVLREFSENTQFIIVTHNKLTMEQSDYLYGVTQEEDGVSKIVSVNFRNNPQFNFA